MGKAHPTYDSKLSKKTRQLLEEHLKLKANTYITIKNETGLSPTWIAMFLHDDIKHADVGRVETLYNYLAVSPLEV